MGTILYSVGQKTYHEYTKQIDFRKSALHCDWGVLIFVNIKRASSVVDGLQSRHLFSKFILISKVLSSGNNIVFSFRPTKEKQDTNIRNRRHLLNYLGTQKIKIIWKEGERGYEIDQSGNIKRKWTLKSQALATTPEFTLLP